MKPDYVGESYVSTYNPKHAWYYLSKQEYHEAWMIKLFDSKPGVANSEYFVHRGGGGGGATLSLLIITIAVLHASFDIGQGGRARKSCETRVLVRF